MSRVALLLLMTAPLAACGDDAMARDIVNRAPGADGLVTGFSTEGARHIRTLVGFRDPESVLYDPSQDVYFVSNVAGFGSARDGNGFIMRIPADSLDRGSVLVAGGRDGVELNAPKGLALVGDTLWVTDIDVVRGFESRTGAAVATIDLAPLRAVQLNDIAAGPNGTLRVTDTGILMVFEGNIHTGPDRIFEIGEGHAVSEVARGPRLHMPNGILWDESEGRWIVVSFDRFRGEVASLGARDSSRRVLRSGSGQLDGVQVLPDGGIMFSSWADSSVHVFLNGADVRVIRELPEPADIGYDARRGRVLVPLTVAGQVQVWELPARR